jgi:hypothetical protein
MRKNPHLNAVLASVYIVFVATFMTYGTRLLQHTEDTVLAPIAMISLFTLSAATMGYLFVYYPLQLYLDGQKKEATQFFMKTLLTFAGITFLVFLTLFLTASR